MKASLRMKVREIPSTYCDRKDKAISRVPLKDCTEG